MREYEYCNYCHRKLGPGEGFEVIGTQGPWKGKRLTFCNEQCLIKWDCTGPDSALQGNQGLNLAEDLDKLRPRN